MKIHIYYRHTSNNIVGKFRPYWFSYENCFKNLLNTIEGRDNVSLTLAMDGDVSKDFTFNYKTKYTLFQTNHKSSLKSWRDLMIHVKSQSMDDNDIIYWVENDYLHVEDWIDKTIELFSTYQGLEYVSLYDHNDKYFLPMYDNLTSKIITTNTHHWRTTPSTCGTYMITRKVFEEDYNIWIDAVGDHNTFLDLQEKKNRFVLTPIPGLSTHCMESLMSPCIDWKKKNYE